MPDEHDPRCDVARLESKGLSHKKAISAMQRKHDAQIAKYGWTSHLMIDSPESPTGYNIHTHNVLESFGHPDFQVVLTLPPLTAQGILTGLVDAVKAGRRFAPGDLAGGIIRGYAVTFAEATEGGRDVLRVIVPDPEGRTARGEIGEEYRVQYEGTR